MARVKDEFTSWMHRNLEDSLNNKPVPSKSSINPDKVYTASPAFTLDVLPKNFSSVKKEEILFIRNIVKKMNIPLLKEHYTLKLDLEIECYLLNSEVSADDIARFIFQVLEGTAFKSKKSIKSMSVKINNSKKDPYNKNQNFIGIVLRKAMEKSYPERIVLEPK